MKEQPILFSGEMVMAILEGRKTQTRRIIKNGTIGDFSYRQFQNGLTLWVRETWAVESKYDGIRPRDLSTDISVWYRADKLDMPLAHGKWRPSIFMPYWTSRIVLEITNITIERLQDITYQDILAEGWDVKTSKPITDGTAGVDARQWYKNLWNSTYDKTCPFDNNPYIWVVEFKLKEVKI